MAKVSRLSNNKKREVNGLLQQALQAIQQRRFVLCERFCKRIDDLQSKNADVANLRGMMANQQGDATTAMQYFMQAAEWQPGRAEFQSNVSAMYLTHGLLQEALLFAKKAVKLQPQKLPFQLAYITVLQTSGEHELALKRLQRLRREQPKNIDVLCKCFRSYYALASYDQAQEALQTALQYNAKHVLVHSGLALLAVEQGDKLEAEKHAREALALQANDRLALSILLDLVDVRKDKAFVQQLAEAYAQAADDSEDKQQLAFAYGKALGVLGDIEASFACIEQGNRIQHQRSSYREEAELLHLEQVMSSYDQQSLQQAKACDSDAPIFIVGMPRCGSSLIEQMLSMHSDVIACGECDAFEAVLAQYSAEQSDEPLTLTQIQSYSDTQWQSIAEAYLQRLQSYGGNAAHYTDKTLSNIRLIGSIHRAFPKAKFVHIHRQPMDVCWSIYRQALKGQSFDYGSDQGELGRYYQAYTRLMAHWQQVLPDHCMLDVSYEALLDDPEQELQYILRFCRLDWQDACLDFVHSKHPVRTASAIQVREPLHKRSIDAWKPYAEHLQVLRSLLGSSSAVHSTL